MRYPWLGPETNRLDLYYSLNSLKGGYIGNVRGTTIGVIKGDTRSLYNGSFGGEVVSENSKKDSADACI